MPTIGPEFHPEEAIDDSRPDAGATGGIDRDSGRTPPPRGGPFVGRADDIASIHRLLADGRDLITLTGPGGVGKTQLAAKLFDAINGSSHPRFPGGAVFVRLDVLADAALVLPTIAREFQVKEVSGKTPLETVVDHLRDRALLLMLDNFEHVLGAAPDISALLHACPGVAVLATSRRHLNLTGETVYRVDPLAVPAPDALSGADRQETRRRIEASDAVRLLVARTNARNRHFAVTDANAPDLAEVCRRVDGLPLALEVVASRLAVLGPKPLLTEMDERLGSLPPGPDDALPRHRTVFDAVAWSYQLLDPATQAIFRRLSVFVDGCALAAADAVAVVAADPTQVSAADGITRLCEENLLRLDVGPNGEQRFAMLATTQAFAAAQLAAAGDEQATRHAHARYFLDLAQRAEVGLVGPDYAAWGATLDAELGNLRLALAWTLDGPEPDIDTGLHLTVALWPYWDRRGFRQEAIDWLNRAASSSTSERTIIRAVVLRRLGNVLGDTNTREATQQYQLGLDLARSLGDQDLVAGLLRNVSRTLSVQGVYDAAIPLLVEAEAICVALQSPLGLARTLANQSRVLRESDRLPEADATAKRLLALLSALDDFELRIWTYLELGRNALARGDLDGADSWLGRGLELADDLAEREWVAYAILERATVRVRRGDHTTAIADLTVAFNTLRDTGTDFGAVLCLEQFASVAAVSGQPDRALMIWGSIDAWRARTGYVVPAFARHRRATERSAAERLAAEGSAPLPAIDPALTLDQAYRIALRVTASNVHPPTVRGADATSPATPSPLSRRETQVLALVAESLTNQEIAERMFISTSTAMKHVEHIFEKLGVNRRMEAVRIGRQSGWLPHGS